jgi:hypothetical protein
MIRVEHIEVFNFEGAIRGLRNPMNSWDKSDSALCSSNFFQDCKSTCDECPRPDTEDSFENDVYCIGKSDMTLMQRLYKAGHPHRKYLRQIMVSMDITSHHTWWSEFDTYKIGVTRNSCSKMHKIHVKSFGKDDFSHEGIDEVGNYAKEHFDNTLIVLEKLRHQFNETHEKKYWRTIIELLPMGYNIKATITMNYENVVNMLQYRQGHKLDEWNEFCKILKNLPYITQITAE